jgi:hypothetical protein
MHIDHCHSTVLGNPIEFAFPDVDCLFLQQQEEREILRKSVGQLDVAFLSRGGNPKRKNRVCAIRLRLERIGVERG